VRFVGLYLRAYGRFSDEVLKFPCTGAADLHLVFGPNEAGKSTTLAAVTDFLFGFEPRASYHFRHDAPELRVGATIATPGGELHAMRRRGRKQTLFAFDPDAQQEDTRQPLADEMLASMLAGLDRQTYRMLFGLDLDELGRGGKALVAGEGEVGQSLFQAAAGLSLLKRASDDLRKTADELFTPRARTAILNKALAEYAGKGREVRERAVRSSVWEAAEQAWRESVAVHERLANARRQAREEHTRLMRIHGNLPLLAQRRALAGELEALHDVPRLPADAGDQRRRHTETMRVAQSAARAAAEEAQRLTIIAESIRFDAALLAAASSIEQLDRQADACAAARAALIVQTAAFAAARSAMRGLLDEIAPGTAEADAAGLLPARTLTASVHRLGKERAELLGKREGIEAQYARAQTELTALRTALAVLPEPQGLAALALALDALTDYPQLESRVREKEARIEADWAEARRRSAELGVRDPDLLAHMSLPTRAAVSGFHAAFEASGRRRAELAGKVESLDQDLAACRLELRKLEAAGEVVTQIEVERARRHRDHGWRLVRRLHVDGEAGATEREAGEHYGAGSSLPQAFESAMREADRLADLLHGDAERAARYAGYAERIEQMTQEDGRLAAAIARIEAEHEALVERWQAVCVPLGLAQAAPDAVLEWLHQRDSFITVYAKLAEQDRELVPLIARREALDRALAQALADGGLPGIGADESARFALQRLKQHQERLAGVQSEHDVLQVRIREYEAAVQRLAAERERAAAALRAWEGNWQAVLAALRLPAGMGGEEAEVRLAQFERLAEEIEASTRAERDIAEQTAIVAAFEGSVAQLKVRLGRTDEQIASEAWVRALSGELTQARAQSASLKEIQHTIERERQRERESLREVQVASSALAELARAAGCAAEALLEVEARAARRLQAESDLHQVERELVRQNGREVAAVVAEAQAFDIDRIARELRETQEGLVRLDDEVRAAQEAESQARRAFQAIDGSAAVAQLRQEQAVLAAEIQTQARRWSRARLAAAMLQRVVQQYRERHQGPLLERAAAIFGAVTCGSFSGLTTDYVDDRQVLLGVRPDGRRVPVEGMSKGTCDQLYLALRLATIEAHLASRGPIPVVVDDLLVQFDDERAVATLRQLSELSRRTQVLFFTHHEHLLALAREAGIVADDGIHRIDRAA